MRERCDHPEAAPGDAAASLGDPAASTDGTAASPDGPAPSSRSTRPADPAGLGRGRLIRWLPVLWHAPEHPPEVTPFAATASAGSTRFLLTVLLSVKHLTIPAAGLGVLWQTGEALVPVVMGAAIDQALATGDLRLLLLWLVALAGVFIMLSLGFRFAAQLATKASEMAQHRLRVTLSRTVLHADRTGAHRVDGSVVSLMTNDVHRTAALGLLVFPVAECAGIIVVAVSLLLIHVPLGLIVLAGAPLTVWIMGLLSSRLARDTKEYQTVLAETVARATDLVTGYRVIKGIRAEAEAGRRYRVASRDTVAAAFRNIGVLGRFLVGSTTVSGVFVAAVAVLAAWFAIRGAISIGELIAAVGLAQALLPAMRMLATNAVPAWAAARASSARVFDAITTAEVAAQTRSDDRDAPAGLSAQVGESAPAGTSASEGTSAPAMETSAPLPSTASVGAPAPAINVTMDGKSLAEVGPGEMVGIHADEHLATALAEALLRPDPDSRITVRLDGADVGDRESLPRYRDEVVIAPHHPLLFSGTIAENVGAGTEHSVGAETDHTVETGTEHRVDTGTAPVGSAWAALNAAACDDFISDAADLDRRVGEMANRLSGGQRQRLALARALAVDSPVLVLHDPTTAVDSVTQQVIASRLPEARRGRSTLLIDSSPVMLGICDRILDLRDGCGEEEKPDE